MNPTLTQAMTAVEQGGEAIALYATHRAAVTVLQDAQQSGGLTGWTVIPSAAMARHNGSGGRVRIMGADQGERRLRGIRAVVVVDEAAKAKLSEAMREAIQIAGL